jgi:hypothetical protein
MGTNFYLKTDVCPHCKRCDDRLHIGKSSAGWCFALHVIPEDGINDLEDWRARWATGVIEDEYGTVLTPADMDQRITQRVGSKDWNSRWWDHPMSRYSSEAHFHDSNSSQRGPNGLLRSRLSRRCIKHGEGTWDCFVGEFS